MVSFWHSALDAEPVRPPLGGSRSADVCIVGAGYTGLWTAYELARADPALDVVVLEAETAGFGASGRNGGWVLGALSGRREHWAERGGRAGAIAQARAIAETVDEVGRVVAAEGIDCDFVKGGSLHVAQTPLELERVVAEVEESRAWEGDDELLDAAATAARVGVAGALGGSFTPHCARVQPAKLARGLAHAAERAGVLDLRGDARDADRPRPRRHAVRDRPRAARRARDRGLHGGAARAAAPAAPAHQLDDRHRAARRRRLGARSAGSAARRCSTACAATRICSAPRTGGSRSAGAASRTGSARAPTARARSTPGRSPSCGRGWRSCSRSCATSRVDGAWHGVLGVPRDWSPAVGLDPATGIAWAGGYVGEGVAAANLAGRTLRDLLLGRSTELTSLPWVGPFARRWEPEPLRFAAVHAVHGLMRAADERERSGGRPAIVGRVAEAISGR